MDKVSTKEEKLREDSKAFIERLSDPDDIEEQLSYDGFVIDYPQDYDP